MKRSLIIAAGWMAFASPALADCPNGHVPAAGGVVSIPSVTFGINAFSIGGGVPQSAFDNGPQTDANCATAGSLSVGGSPAVTGSWQISDNGTPGDTTDDVSVYLPPVSAVLGQNSSAMGNGATVGRVETYNDDMGTPDDTTDDVERTRIVPVNNATAIGAGSSVQHNNSTAVGAGAKSSDANQVTLGTKDETIRAEGITSQKSKDRQIGATEIVTTDAEGRLATDGGSTFRAISANTALLSQHTAKLEEHSKGLAIAMAMPDAWLSDKKRFGIFGAIGGFEGETAIGFAAIGRLDETFSVNAKLGADTDFDHIGWQVGVGAQW
jgi:trimeric autotransporter adhesin